MWCHLSACLTLRKKSYWTDLCENSITDVSVDKKELIKFWKSSAFGSRKFLKDSSTVRDGAFFHNLAHISGKRHWIFMKIFLSLSKKDSIKSGSRTGRLLKFSKFFLVHRYICCKISRKIHSVVFKQSCWQTDRQTDRQTNKRRALHNLLGGGNYLREKSFKATDCTSSNKSAMNKCRL